MFDSSHEKLMTFLLPTYICIKRKTLAPNLEQKPPEKMENIRAQETEYLRLKSQKFIRHVALNFRVFHSRSFMIFIDRHAEGFFSLALYSTE